jgi:hypothetical protein
MPWKIVNLDYGAQPHLHMKDPNAPIHLRTFFTEQRVEIGLGGEDPHECFVRAQVTADDVVVQATKFEPIHVQILGSILGSLDVDPEERDEGLAWMKDRVKKSGGSPGFLDGNVASFPPPSGWPFDLDDASLMDSLEDREAIPHTRRAALLREARRRGLRPASSGPEIIRRR